MRPSALSLIAEFFQPREGIDCCVALTLAGASLLLVRRWPTLMLRVEEWARTLSRSKGINILLSAATPLLLRACLLGWAPAPLPATHDEFSHLLLADTIAAGRLANPPHPFPQHFETIYVLQSPAYASVYPPGQGIVLGLTQRIAGDPWWGVWLSIAAMSGAICWALSMWTSGSWSLLGGLLAGLIYGVSTYWMNSYWGGAVSATGGALVFGALGGLRHSLRADCSVLLAVGLVLCGYNRPYETVCACIALLIIAFTLHQSGHWSLTAAIQRLVLPAALVLLPAAVFLAVYNRAVTGSALEVPYHADQKIHGVPQSFIWQPVITAGPFRFKDIEDCYLWQRQKRLEMSSIASFTRRTAYKLFVIWNFYINWWFTLPILCFLVYRRGRLVWAIAAVCAFAFFTSALYTYLLPHYLALYTVVFVFLAIEGIRRTRKQCWRGIPVGILLLAFTGSGAVLASLDLVGPYATPVARASERDRIASALEARGGSHLVLVRYDANHSFYDEWIYNRADIDHSAIVWARDLTPAENEQLIHYYPERTVWLVEGREANAQIRPYRSSQPVP